MEAGEGVAQACSTSPWDEELGESEVQDQFQFYLQSAGNGEILSQNTHTQKNTPEFLFFTIKCVSCLLRGPWGQLFPKLAGTSVSAVWAASQLLLGLHSLHCHRASGQRAKENSLKGRGQIKVYFRKFTSTSTNLLSALW